MREEIGVVIRALPTGVPGLDAVLGGGLPEYSFNVLAGPPGSGKTTLAHQLMFGLATLERPALYITVLGEPPLKMLRYQQQFAFFDQGKVGTAVHYRNLAQEVQAGKLDEVLASILREVGELNPGIVVVDSFRSLSRGAGLGRSKKKQLRRFTHELSLHLATWEATTLLLGEYGEQELVEDSVSTVADGLLWLSAYQEDNAVSRKLQVKKVRGQEQLPGLHSYAISRAGLQVFPRLPQLPAAPAAPPAPRPRLSTGVAGLDRMMGGGVPAGDVVLISGPVGAGKTVLAAHFLAAGDAAGEPGVMVLFEEPPGLHAHNVKQLGHDLQRRVDAGTLKLLYVPPYDLSPAEVLHQIQAAVTEVGARRVVMDSMSALEMYLAPSFQEEFREALYRMTRSLVAAGITVLLTVETTESFTEVRVAPEHPISFIADDVLVLRYIEVDGRLRRMLTVIKMRGSSHSDEFHAYTIEPERGLVIGEALKGYRGLLLGVPEWLTTDAPPQEPAPAKL